MIALDTETTGLDLYHGAKPFLVTTCDEAGYNRWWEWYVDPVTREPLIPPKDLRAVQRIIDRASAVILQSAKFDYAALQTVFKGKLHWNWGKVHDTLLAGHLLASNEPHDLSSMVMKYLRKNIDPIELAVKQACNAARLLVGKEFPKWHTASVGLPEMPSAKKDAWKYDLWLPRAVAKRKRYLRTHPWWTVCQEYGNTDPAATIELFKVQRKLLEERGLWRIYQERLKVLPVVCKMERRGVTINSERLEGLTEEYQGEAAKAGRVCCNIAKEYGYELKLPGAGVNNSLREFVFDKMKLVSHKSSKKTGKPSMDKDVINEWLVKLPKQSKKLAFIRALRDKRKRDTALSYMEGYKRFWLPDQKSQMDLARQKLERGETNNHGIAYQEPLWYILHPSLNPTGTDTLRWSSSNPNEQNISKQEGFNLRYCFGPAPGREWWSLDAKNIELRIPAYEAGEQEMMNLFEREDEPPYYGSYHMLIFDTLHSKRFAKDGMECKKLYESTWYQWTKNGNFAVQYGAVEASGTADRAYHVPGAQKRIQRRFGKVAELNRRMIAIAERQGYIETMPDKTVDPKRGYPLLCTRSEYGRILPTVPLNYYVQGTACWWMMKGMIRCQAYLDTLVDHYMILQVHDELVFDFPQANRGTGRVAENMNLPKIRKIQKLMEQGGEDIGVPTPVGIEYHSTTWSEGVGL